MNGPSVRKIEASTLRTQQPECGEVLMVYTYVYDSAGFLGF